MKVMVAGILSLVPFSPGIAWDWLQVAVGLKRLGHDVWFIEEVPQGACVDRAGAACDYEHSIQRARFTSLMRRFDLWPDCCQLFGSGVRTTGLTLDELGAAAATADILLNMSGHCRSDVVLEKVKCRVYVDQDPVYTQLWRSEYAEDLDFDRHDVFFTVGWNIGTDRTIIPDGGVEWHHLLPPVVPDLWPRMPCPNRTRFTTMASWLGYSDVEYAGDWYGSKYSEFERFARAPELVRGTCEVALREFRDTDQGIELLRSHGWIVSRAGRWATMDGYQEFIAGSGVEIGIAQNAYVKANSGWFSDRASHYLATGRPVLAQATGFESHFPTGTGLISFRDEDELARGADAIASDYARHRQGALDFVERHLDYRRVLAPMVSTCSEYL